MPRTSSPRVNLEQATQARTVKSVFVVQHAYELWDREDVKLIGVYGTRSEAGEAVDRARAQPGFCHWPDGFSVDEYALGKDHWTEGFAKVVSIHVEVTGPDSSRLECVHAEWRPGEEDFTIVVPECDSVESTKRFRLGVEAVRKFQRTTSHRR